MFLNLFDAHPQLLTYPLDLNILYGYFPAYIDRPGLTREDLVKRLNRVIFDDLHQFDLADRGLAIDSFRETFFRIAHERDLRDLGQVLSCQTEAFEETIGRSGERRLVVVKETSIELYARSLAQTFPRARFIQLIRDPRDNYSALRAGIERYRTFGDDERMLIFSAQQRMSLGMKIASINQGELGPDRYLVLRFEDLVAAPEATMKRVAGWLGVDFVPTLLQPTVLGKPTRGNSYQNIAMFDVSSRNVGRWRERISAEEAALIEFLLADEMRSFGYMPELSAESGVPLVVADYYKWLNYNHLFFDRFAV
jgi:hypothetical protein